MYPMRVLLVFCLRGKEREINLHLLIHFPNGQGQESGISSGFAHGQPGPSTQLTFCCLPSTSAGCWMVKQSSLGLNHCSNGMLAPAIKFQHFPKGTQFFGRQFYLSTVSLNCNDKNSLLLLYYSKNKCTLSSLCS